MTSPVTISLRRFICAVVLGWSLTVAPAKDAPPNIVLIFADDLDYGDIGPFGSTRNRTPHLDRMAREGMKLTSFYAAPVCTPSRSGRHKRRAGRAARRSG